MNIVKICSTRNFRLMKIANHLHTRTMSSAPNPQVQAQDEVLFEEVNNRGIITLNKPKVLNSINLPMVVKIMCKLEEWEGAMDMVIIRSAEGKAFCAGGDIVAVTKGGKDHSAEGKKFFRSEYLMNCLIGTYKVPYVALLDGITMGGGVGLSVHGKYRVATENTLFAMPETAIGLFPDVGGGYFLPRLRGKLGLYLALTGHRLKGTDVVQAGIATHFCESAKLPDLYKALTTMKTPLCDMEKDVFDKYTKNIAHVPFSLECRMNDINRIFSMSTVEEIMDALEQHGNEWAITTLNVLKKMSPTSMKITKKQLEKGSQMSLQQVLQMENRLAASTLEGKISMDFYEGVRALLIDKDKKPKWSPKTLEEVTDQMVDSLFEPLKDPSEELIVG